MVEVNNVSSNKRKRKYKNLLIRNRRSAITFLNGYFKDLDAEATEDGSDRSD